MEMYGYEFVRESDLAHHGIKGQKWGQRRFQNEDGSWTAAGKERYGEGGGEKLSRKERRLAKINDRIASAQNASQMENAIQRKAKEDFRATQNPLSRVLNDLSGYNDRVARRVVEDIRSDMLIRDARSQREKMTRGQKAIDFMSGNSSTNAANKYSSKGYKNLNSEYENYRNSGGLKKSRKNYDRDYRMRAQAQRYERRAQERQANRKYENEQKARTEEMQRVAQEMNAMTEWYKRNGR